MKDAIVLVFSNMTVTLLIIGLIVAAIMALSSRHRRQEPGFISAAFLNQFLLFSVGISYLYNFIMHSVFGDFIAKEIGWAQSPFQLEVAFASLGLSVSLRLRADARSW